MKRVRVPTGEENRTPIKSFVFLDMETSGLDPNIDRITEICLMAVHHEALLSKSVAGATGFELPRVVDKLTLCVCPNTPISRKSSELSKLDNYNLSRKAIFDADAVTMLKLFISRQEGPVCLVAHNGDRFDFEFLWTELQRLGERLGDDILCADSLKAYAATDGAPVERILYKKYGLGTIYQRTFRGATIPNAHSAEADVIALIQITLARADALCKWMDKNAVSFSETETIARKRDKSKPKPSTSTQSQ